MSGPTSVELPSDELGAYQTLNNLAVLSLVLGVLSVLSFAPFWMFVWLLPPAAIVSGLFALKQIAAAPDVWAGQKLARAGIGLAIICGGLATVRNTWTGWTVRSNGKAVAARFVEKIANGEMEAAYWLMFPKEARTEFAKKGMDELPQEILERYANFRAEASPIADAAATGGLTFEFETVEGTGSDHQLDFALVIYNVHTPEGDKRLLLETVGRFSEMSNEIVWWIRSHKFDYAPGTHEVVKPSGHGHSH